MSCPHGEWHSEDCEICERDGRIASLEADRKAMTEETAATVVRLTAEIDEYADQLAAMTKERDARDGMLKWVYTNYGEVLPGYEDAGDLKNWLADLRSRANNEEGS